MIDRNGVELNIGDICYDHYGIEHQHQRAYAHSKKPLCQIVAFNLAGRPRVKLINPAAQQYITNYFGNSEYGEWTYGRDECDLEFVKKGRLCIWKNDQG